MTQQERIEYHARRASEEQERGRVPGAPAHIARVHNQLADLHLERAEALRNGTVD